MSKKSPLNTLLLPVGGFDPGIRVILVATVNSLPTVLMDGIITQHTVTPSNEPGQSTLSVTGQDVSVILGLGNGGLIGAIAEEAIPFPNLPTVAIIDLLLLKYATYEIIPLVVPPLQVDVPLITDHWPTKSGYDSDLDFIKSAAEDVGYVFYIDPGPVPGTNIGYFGPEIRIGVPQSALNVDMDAETNVESLSFTYDGMAREQPSIVVMDPITGKIPIPIPIPDVSLLRPPLAIRPALAMRSAPLDDVASLDPIPAMLLGVAASAKPDAITGSGTLDVLRYGRPLKARQLVGVRRARTTGCITSAASPTTSSAGIQAELQPGARRSDFTYATGDPMMRARTKKRFFGKYRGIVELNSDPERKGGIQAMVPAVLGKVPTTWALPCLPNAGVMSGVHVGPGGRHQCVDRV